MDVRARVLTAIGLVFLGGHVSARVPAARQGQPTPSLAVLLEASAGYLDHYAKALSAVVATEAYRFHGSSILNSYKSLQSEVLLIGANEGWIEFRDVFEVDGHPVRDHDARLQALFANPSGDVLAEAQKIANESARYNMGFARTINVPTMALSYLTRHLQARSTFRIEGRETIDQVPVTVVSFKETAQPSLIRVAIGVAQTSGRYWIDDGGAVRRTELSLRVPRGTVNRQSEVVNGDVKVDYAIDPDLRMLVPSRMQEHYDQPQRLDGDAAYSHFRTFAVDVSTLMRKGGGGR